MHIPAIGNTSDQAASYLVMTNFGIPLIGSMSAGFTIGFMMWVKGEWEETPFVPKVEYRERSPYKIY
jgi:hypothetical protein